MQKRFITIFATVLAVMSGAEARAQKDIAGYWQGTLEAGQGLRTVLKIARDGDKYKAAMYSLDQGGEALPVNAIALTDTAVHYSIDDLKLTYTGTLSPDGKSIEGKATQNRQTMTLNLMKVTPDEMWAIPEPSKPMPKNAKPQFEVVTIKPGNPATKNKYTDLEGRHVLAVNYNVDDLISDGYGLHRKQIVGAPEWFNSDLFDIDGVPDIVGTPSDPQIAMMLQGLLRDRFQLKFHHEQREMAVYTITVANGGPKMKKTIHEPDQPNEFGFTKLGSLIVTNITMADFASQMQGCVTDRPLVDRTGLTDRYDFKLKWTPDESQFEQFRSAGMSVKPAMPKPNAPPDIFTAMQQQLGLKLQPAKMMTDVIVIDHVEKPSAN